MRVESSGWADLGHKMWRAFVVGFLGGAVTALTPILDALSAGADTSGDVPKALLSGVVFGGLVAALRAVYAVLPLDEADNKVGMTKVPTGKAVKEAATELKGEVEAVEKSVETVEHAAKALADAATRIEERAATLTQRPTPSGDGEPGAQRRIGVALFTVPDE